MSTCWQMIKNEFTEETLHLSGYDFRRFYVFWWPVPPLLNMVYRVVLAAYVDFWLCYFIKENALTTKEDDLPWLVYLTHWTYILTAVYQTSYALVCISFHTNQFIRRGHSIIHALDRRSHSAYLPQLSGSMSNTQLRRRSYSQRSLRSFRDSDIDFRDRSPHASATTSNNSPSGHGSRQQSIRERHRLPSARESNSHFSLSDLPHHHQMRVRGLLEFASRRAELPWYLKAIHIMFSIISPVALIVSAVYYIFLLPEDGEPFSRENLHMHFMNSVMIIVEHLVNALPVRLLHLIFPTLYLVVYMLFTICYWMYDDTQVIYPGVVNWNNPGGTLSVLLVIALVILPGAQMFFYSIYHIKVALYEGI